MGPEPMHSSSPSLLRREPLAASRTRPVHLSPAGGDKTWIGAAASKASDLTGLTKLKEEALHDMQVPPADLPKRPNALLLGARAISRRPDLALAIFSKPAVQTDLNHLLPRSTGASLKTMAEPEFGTLSTHRKQAHLLSNMGVGAGKLAQLLASDEGLPAATRKVLEELKSGGAPTRSLREAQAHADALYGEGTYRISKVAGVGTIGEVYHATRAADGKPLVIKMLKHGISEKSLQAELRIAKEFIGLAYPEPSKCAYKSGMVEKAYNQWTHELDFSAEAENAKLLADGAQRYKVAQPLDIGRAAGSDRAVSLVFEKAEGVPLDKLTKMLHAYKRDPQAYVRDYQAEFLEHPWLRNPQNWMQRLPESYREAMNEQTLLRVKSSGVSVSHGDPHSGNIFVTLDPFARKPDLTFIDTGLVVKRSGAEVAKHTGIMFSLLTGDVKAISRHIVEMAENLPNEAVRSEKRQWIENELNRRLFKAHVDITNSRFNSSLMDELMEQTHIHLSERDLIFARSQFQTMATHKDLSAIAGQACRSYLRDSLPDIGRSLGKLVWHQPVATVSHIVPTVSHVAYNPQDAARNALQFILRRPPTNG